MVRRHFSILQEVDGGHRYLTSGVKLTVDFAHQTMPFIVTSMVCWRYSCCAGL
jgi:hypothetical protein